MNHTFQECLDKTIEFYSSPDIRIEWEGGNDDGCYELFVDGNRIADAYKNDFTSDLISNFAQSIGHFSFAGDFICSGQAEYDKSENAFVGNDSYEENKEFCYPIDLTYKISPDLWFDSIKISVDGYGEGVNAEVFLVIKNGPVSEDHINFEKSLKVSIENDIQDSLSRRVDELSEINSLYIDFETSMENLNKDENGNYIIFLDHVYCYMYDGEERRVLIPIS